MPFTFKDTKEREWDLKINMGIAQVIDKSDFSSVTKLKFAFLQPDQEFFGEVFSNVQLQVAMAWAIVQPQLSKNFGVPSPIPQEKLELLEYKFVEGLDGDSLQELKQALMESIADFFPEQRTVLLTLQTKFKKTMKMAELEFLAMDKVLDEAIEKEIKTAASEAVKKLRGEDTTEPSEPLDGNQEMLRDLLSKSSS